MTITVFLFRIIMLVNRSINSPNCGLQTVLYCTIINMMFVFNHHCCVKWHVVQHMQSKVLVIKK